MQVDWRATEMLDYLDTWSACQRARKASGEDPLAAFAEPLKRSWGNAARTVRWPLFLTATRAAG